MKTLRLSLAPLLLAAAALPASARTRPYAGVAVEELYDSNVLNSQGADGVTRVQPRVGALIDSHRWAFEGEYMASLHAYALGKSDNSVNHRAAAYGRLAFTRRLEGQAGATLVIADDPVLLDRPGVAVPQGGVIDLDAAAGLSWRAARRITADARYEYRRSRFDLAHDSTGLAYDGDEHRLDGGLSSRLSRRLDGRVRGRFQEFISYGIQPDQTAAGASGGLTWRMTRLWRIEGDVGPLWVPSGDLTLYGQGRLVRSGRRARIALVASRDLYGGTGADGATWSNAARIDLAWRLGRNLALRGRAGGYLTEQLSGGGDVSGLVARAELGWLSQHGHWRFDFYAEHRAQDAGGGIAFTDVQRTLVGVRLSAVAGADFLTIEEEGR